LLAEKVKCWKNNQLFGILELSKIGILNNYFSKIGSVQPNESTGDGKILIDF